jgi:hypothetical protein
VSVTFPELKYVYAIAGLRVLTNRPAFAPDLVVGTDGLVQVVFLREQKDLQDIGLLGNIKSSSAWHRLPERYQAPAYFRSDGYSELQVARV